MSMTVRELIEHLAQFESDMDVMYLDDGCVLKDIRAIEVQEDPYHYPAYDRTNSAAGRLPANVVVIE